MLKSGGSSIVKTASTAGLVGNGVHPPYAASKHGILGLTKQAALYHTATGIR
jgi:NAD(P)-dependent dehydrogenase (short-subunit alcohol dehydrogenase family)